MAESNDKGLIGFDPLAWMDDDSKTDETEIQAKEPEIIEPVIESIEQNTAEQRVAEITVEQTLENEDKSMDDCKLTLDATLNIQNVTQLYEQLLKLLEGQGKVEIDASEVVVIDTSTLQLLIVFKQTAINLQKEVVFDFPSDKFIESAELLGLAEMLDVDQAAAGLF